MPPSEAEKIFRAFAEERKRALPQFTPDGIPITLENKFDDAIYNYLYEYWKTNSGEYDPKDDEIIMTKENSFTKNEKKFEQWLLQQYGMTNKEQREYTLKGNLESLWEIFSAADMVLFVRGLPSIGKELAQLGKKAVDDVAEEAVEKTVKKEVAEEAVEKTVKREVAEEVAENTTKKEMVDTAEDLSEKTVKKESDLENSGRVKEDKKTELFLPDEYYQKLDDNIANAITARDAEVTKIQGLSKTQQSNVATVVAGVDIRTGDVYVGVKNSRIYKGNATCAEDIVFRGLGGNTNANIIMTSAIRPRNNEIIPVCTRCQTKYPQNQFVKGTTFQ